MQLDLVEPQRLMRDHLRSTPLAYCQVGMGLGKTATTLVSILDRINDLEIDSALVVAPLRVATMTWPWEAQKWAQTRDIRIADLRTAEGQKAFVDGSAQLYTINYESLHKLKPLVKKRRGKLPYGAEVWDEITSAKNQASKRINRFRRDLPRAPIRWGLTGTPLPNSLLDIFAQIRLLDDGARLGKSFAQFRERYFQATDYMRYSWAPREGAEEKIYKAISDMTVTLTSEEWLDIPDVHIEDIEVTLPDLKMYRQLEKDLLLEIKGQTINAVNSAVLVTKLLQFTSGVVYDENREHVVIHDAKIQALKKLVSKVKEPILVATQFIHEKERIRAAFPEAKFVEDHGPELFRAWNQGKVKMLVSHPKSVGHGLNLQDGGRYLVWFTLPHSREHYEQMIARLARRGQSAETTIFRLMCTGTVDEVVAEALRGKANTENRFIEALKLLERLREK